jgi:hypothetical protein
MLVGFSHASALIREFDLAEGIRRYNGSGLAAERYASQVLARSHKWAGLLHISPAPKAKPKKVTLPRNWWKRYVFGDTDANLDLMIALAEVAKDLNGRIFIRFGKRTRAEQLALWNEFVLRNKRPPLVARPGTSRHETGRAADCQFVPKRGSMVNLGQEPGVRPAMRRHGLCLPVRGETWHAELGNVWNA